MMQAKAKPPVLGNRKPTDPQISLADVAFHLAGWPTPMVGSSGTVNYNGSNSTDSSRQTEALCGKEVAGHNLVLSGWPTARASDGENNARTLQGAINESERKSWNNDLGVAAFSTQLPDGPARLTVSGVMLTGSDAGMASGGQLNLDHSLWLMGCPPEWANSVPGRSDWLRWQDLMRQVSSAPSHTESSACVVLEMPLTPKPQSPGSKP